MGKNAKIYTLTGSIISIGYTDFTSDGSFNASIHTQVALNDTAFRIATVDIKYQKVVSGDIVEMNDTEKLFVNTVFPLPLSSELPIPLIADGYTTTTSTNFSVVRGTTYNEPITNAQRSLVSNNVNDAAAGTGARKVQIRYFNQSLTGPYFETVTMNGTTPVNTVATDICFIERMDVVEVGSQQGNLGTITLKTATAGGGTDIGSIAAGDNETNWCHHYVTVVDPVKLSEIVGTNKSSVLGDLHARVAYPTLPLKPETTVVSPIRLVPGETFVYQPNPPVQVVGPSRITLYVKPVSAATSDWAASLGYYEEEN